MKKIILLLFVSLFMLPKQSKSQNEGEAVSALALGAVAIGTVALEIHNMEELAELHATEYILANFPEISSFSLKTLDFDGKKFKDMSLTTVVSYEVQEFTPEDRPELDGEKYILLAFTSYGWISEYGIDFNKVEWFLLDKNEWLDMMVLYVSSSSKETNADQIRALLKKGKIVDTGVRVNGKLEIPFFKLSGDMYVVADYDEDMKLVYNEKSLGIFLAKSNNLIQMGRRDIIKIHNFLMD